MVIAVLRPRLIQAPLKFILMPPQLLQKLISPSVSAVWIGIGIVVQTIILMVLIFIVILVRIILMIDRWWLLVIGIHILLGIIWITLVFIGIIIVVVAVLKRCSSIRRDFVVMIVSEVPLGWVIRRWSWFRRSDIKGGWTVDAPLWSAFPAGGKRRAHWWTCSWTDCGTDVDRVVFEAYWPCNRNVSGYWIVWFGTKTAGPYWGYWRLDRSWIRPIQLR